MAGQRREGQIIGEKEEKYSRRVVSGLCGQLTWVVVSHYFFEMARRVV